MTTNKKYSLKETLLRETKTYPDTDNHPLILALASHASEKFTSYDGTILKFMQPDACATLLDIRLSDDPERPDALYIEKLEVLRYPYGEIDLECFGKGYAKEVLTLLAQEADRTRTELYLIAAPEARDRRAFPQLPDKDQLAALYARYGFVEDFSNFAQVGMTRVPRQSAS
jgi:hypothetical protein